LPGKGWPRGARGLSYVAIEFLCVIGGFSNGGTYDEVVSLQGVG